MKSTETSIPSGVLTDREKLWAAMRRLREFDRRELALASKVDRRHNVISEYTSALVKAGILSQSKQKKGGEFVRFELMQDSGVDAPRVRKDGSFVPDSGQTRMWRVMKILKLFSVRDLVVYAALPEAGIGEDTAATYCRWLVQGDYLREYPGGEHDVTRYRFLRDTGAKAPQILRVKQLFDPNTGEIVVREPMEQALNREAS